MHDDLLHPGCKAQYPYVMVVFAHVNRHGTDASGILLVNRHGTDASGILLEVNAKSCETLHATGTDHLFRYSAPCRMAFISLISPQDRARTH